MDKLLLTVSVTVFGLVASYVPVWFGLGDAFSVWSILFGLVGSLIGIWVWYRYLRFE